MKRNFLSAIVFLLLIFGTCFSQIQNESTLEDGLYLITKIDTNPDSLSQLSENETAVHFSKLFEDYNEEGFLRLIINTSDYVPLELEKTPITEQQTESKKNYYYL